MYLSYALCEAMGNWAAYGGLLLKFAAEDMHADLEMIAALDTNEQLDFLRRWDGAGGCVKRCPSCGRAYASRHKICEACGDELGMDDWTSEGVTRMLATLRPLGALS